MKHRFEQSGADDQIRELLEALVAKMGVMHQEPGSGAGEKKLPKPERTVPDELVAELFNVLYTSCVITHDVFEAAYASRHAGRDSAELKGIESALTASRTLVPGMHLLAAWLGIPVQTPRDVAGPQAASSDAPVIRIVD
jgi:hypothetical protein